MNLRIARAKALVRRPQLALEGLGSGQSRLELCLKPELIVLQVLKLIALSGQQMGQRCFERRELLLDLRTTRARTPVLQSPECFGDDFVQTSTSPRGFAITRAQSVCLRCLASGAVRFCNGRVCKGASQVGHPH
jgi:hypothetical protein